MLLIDLGVLGAVTTLGFLAGRLVLGRAHMGELLGLAFPLGAGILTWSLFLWSLAGLPLTRLSSAGVWFALTALAATALITRLARPMERTGTPEESIRAHALGPLLVTVILGLSAVIAVGNAYSAWDGAAIWSIKGYGIAIEGSILAARSWGSHGLAYPLNIPILISLFAQASGDVVPGSILIFPFFQASLLLTTLCYWGRSRVVPWLAITGLALLATIPALFSQSTIGMANVPLTCYIVLGTLFGIQGVFEARRGAHIVSGLMFGLACWTRVEGILFVASILLAICLASLLATQGSLRPLPWLLPIVVIGGSWLVFYRLEGAQGAQATRAVDRLVEAWRAGTLGVAPARIMFGYLRRSLFAPGIWGAIFPAILVMLAYGVRVLRPRQAPSVIALLFAGTATGLMTLVIFFIGSFTSSGLFGWMTRGFPREFLTTPVLFLVAGILAASTRWSQRRSVPAVDA